ncbi:hypothetical protein IWQ61_006461 [Dispira simplex]|nr:hypothetical protein IWQ61_006461 [Dispira simplex]
MGICFVGKRRRFAEFLTEYIPPSEPGPVVSNTGQIVGNHQGIFSFTIGQCARIHYGPHKWFVFAKDFSRNTIYVAPGHDHPLLCIIQLTATHPSWLNSTDAQFAMRLQRGTLLQAQVRYNQPPQWCHVQQMDEHLLRVQFVNPIRGVAPGQVSLSAVVGVSMRDIVLSWVFGYMACKIG